MIVVDTNALLWSHVTPQRLSRAAASALRRERQHLVPSICLWEIAMLTTRNRFRLPVSYQEFVAGILGDTRIAIQEITPMIALRSAQLTISRPMDPADQLIAATAIALDAPLVSADERMRGIPGLRLLW